jgi:hypothetical protein
MTQALVGLFAGAILAGAGQIILSRRDRRNAARVAARLLWRDLRVATTLLKHDRGGVRSVSPARLRQSLTIWDEKQEQFAAGVNAKDFYAVMSGFNAILRQADLRDQDEDGRAELAAQDLLQIEDACALAWRASISRFDRSLDPKKVGVFAHR